MGLPECLPVYSGGLGILSGDHLKSSSDQDYPLIGLGLLYQQGYFRQILNPDGWQQERYPMNDFYTLPLGPVKDADGQDLKVTVKLPTGPVYIQVWKLDVGRITLYLLDTNIPENQLPQDRDITDSLYGGDIDTRIRQEIVLGIGGMRALKAMGLKPTVFHMNEGHSAFLALEQIRLYMRDAQLTFEEALEAARTSNVFTTHTPVPAGIDLFDPGLMYHYFSEYCNEIGIDFQQLMALGRRNVYDRDERFSMAVLALHTSSYRNAVSRLHRAGFAGNVPRPVAATAGLGSADHVDHEWNACPELAERRSGEALRSIPAARLARPFQRHRHLGAGQRHSGRRTARSASPSKASAGHLRARAAACVGAAAASLGGGGAARRRSARPQRLHHRVRAPLRHLQARHAALPRCGAAEANPAWTRTCRSSS